MQRYLIVGLALTHYAVCGHAQLAGTLTSIGSDTMREVMAGWGEAFTQAHPDVKFRMQARGSATAPEALNRGQSDLAPMSRPMTAEEIDAFRRAHGDEPRAYRVALDALAVYVHRDNPVNGLSMDQIDAIFSPTRRCQRGFFSDSSPIDHWNDVSFSRLGAIALYGRGALSGTHAFFAATALCNGRFKDSIVEFQDSASVVEAVAGNPNAIGYAGIGYRTDGVRAVALSPQASSFEGAYYSYYVDQYSDDDDPERRYGWVVRGRYPLSRYLHLYTHEDGDSDALVHAFVTFALSDTGQRMAHDAGFIPLPRRVVASERARLTVR